MMCSDYEPEKGNSPHGVDHPQRPESIPFGRKMVHDLGHHPEAREDENVHFRVAKKSEEVLVEDGISPAGGIEERRVKVAIC